MTMIVTITTIIACALVATVNQHPYESCHGPGAAAEGAPWNFKVPKLAVRLIFNLILELADLG